MSLRARFTLLAAGAVAIAIALAAAIGYVTVRDRLFGEADRSLRDQAGAFARGRPNPMPTGPSPGPRDMVSDRYVQWIGTDGVVSHPSDQPGLPVGSDEREVARDGDTVVIRSVEVDGDHFRMITFPDADGTVVQIARPLDEIDNTLSSLRIALVLVALGGIALAAGLGYAVARTALRPVQHLTDAAEHVAETQDLDAAIDVDRRDEIGRLATSFNTMLAALSSSRAQQQQLVADASHELRTPLTSVRTNIEVLASQPGMPADERDRVLADVTVQMEELSVLVGDLVELARDDSAHHDEEAGTFRLDDLVERAVDRANLHAHGVETRLLDEEPAVVDGRRSQIERALANLLDNACKWSPAGGVVEVRQHAGTVTVRDHGPGIAPADLPHVFDRFYRSPEARSMPGSGLGLSIVRSAIEEHGGTVRAARAAGGGTIVTMELPTTAPGRDAGAGRGQAAENTTSTQ